jgi:KDO2-lipid IV(A) lauroyltransferase
VAAAEPATWRAFLAPRYWPTWLGVALLRGLSLLPLPLLAVLGAGLGMLFYALHGGRRRVVRTNIARCFPHLSARERARLVRAQYYGAGQALFDLGIAWWGSLARLKRLTRFRGREHYDAALAAGRNVILIAPHFFAMDLGGIRLSPERPMVSVFRHPDNALIAFLMLRARCRFGGLLVEHNKPFKTLVRLVRDGHPLYYLPDQDAGRRSAVFAPFFGIPAATFAVLPRLAAMTNAVVMLCFTRQLARGRGYEIVFRPPLGDFPSGDVLADTTRMNREIETCVREVPSQYFWLHKRFKTRPEGEPRFYG